MQEILNAVLQQRAACLDACVYATYAGYIMYGFDFSISAAEYGLVKDPLSNIPAGAVCRDISDCESRLIMETEGMGRIESG